MRAANLSFLPTSENENCRILRFLRARKFNINETFAMIQEHIACQVAMDYSSLCRMPYTDVLKCDMLLFFEQFPLWFHGEDKQGRPILWGDCGKVEIWKLMELTTLEGIRRVFTWICAQIERRLEEKCKVLGCNIETVVVILDASGWNMGLATKSAFGCIKDLVKCASAHYPERLGILSIVNAPVAFLHAWNVAYNFLEDSTKSNVQIWYHEDDWQSVLQSFIDVNQIPSRFGGTASDFSAAQAISSLSVLLDGDDELSKNKRSGCLSIPQPPVSLFAKAKHELEMKLSLTELNSPFSKEIANADIITKHRRGADKTLSSSNLTILGPRRDRNRKRDTTNDSESMLAPLRTFGNWISDALQLTSHETTTITKSRRGVYRSREKRRNASASDDSDDFDLEYDSSGSHSSHASSDSNASSNSSSTTVYDEEGGNVFHCRAEDNIIPLSSQLADDMERAVSNWHLMDTKWKFDASTQTDISSFDPKFLFTKQSECAKWSDVFTRMKIKKKTTQE